MERFVLYIIVGLLACSNFACAGDWKDACPLEIETASGCGKTFQGYKGYIPTCWEDFRKILWDADFSCADDCRSNLISCKEDFKSNDIKGSVKRCIEAYWGCYNDCSEDVVQLYKENEKELKECLEKFTAAFLKWREDKWDEVITALQPLDISERCWAGVQDHFKQKCNSYLRSYGMCS